MPRYQAESNLRNEQKELRRNSLNVKEISECNVSDAILRKHFNKEWPSMLDPARTTSYSKSSGV